MRSALAAVVGGGADNVAKSGERRPGNLKTGRALS